MSCRTVFGKGKSTSPNLLFFLLALPLSAQESGAPPLEEVIVTGSRLQKDAFESPSPVTQIEGAELMLTGTTRIEDLVRSLPQVYSEQNSGVSNGAAGTATIDLRNLGSQRTLVLLDGRRLPSGSPYTAGSADINQIPGALIDRIEILTGGGSATYGSDAVAGVVNFILVDDFDGVKLDYQFSQFIHENDDDSMEQLLQDAGYEAPDGTAHDGNTSNFSVTAGRNFAGDRGNVTAYVSYRDIDAVVQSDRLSSACALDSFSPPEQPSCAGSLAIAEGFFSDFFLLELQGLPSFFYMVAGDQFVPWDGRFFNYAPQNYFQRPDERWTAGLLSHFEFSSRAEVYAQFMYMDDRSVSQIAPSAAFFVTSSLSCGNPLLSQQQFDALCGAYGLDPDDRQIVYIGRRNVEGGPRRDDLGHASYRGVIGLRGHANDAWRYELFGQYARVNLTETYENEFLVSHIERALEVTTDPATGQPVCQSVLDGTDPDCVPWNIFRDGGVSQDAVDYLSKPLFTEGMTDQLVVSGYVSGHLAGYGVRSPLADDGADLVLGAEYREENLDRDPDPSIQAGDAAGFTEPVAPLEGGYHATEVFAELSVPLLENNALTESLHLDLGYRYSDFSTGETTDTYKIAAVWAPVQTLRLRGSVQHAVRLPNIEELFTPQTRLGGGFLEGPKDPCAGPTPSRPLADCARTGVTGALYGTIPQTPGGFDTRVGGNPNLESEKSDTLSAGLSIQPYFIEDLSVSADWYKIEIDGAIATVDAESTLLKCLDGGDPFFCDQIHRDPETGDLWIPGSDGFIDGINQNVASITTSGIDVAVHWEIEAGGAGTLAFENFLTYTDEWRVQAVSGDPALKCEGKWGGDCVGTVIPEIRNYLRVTWATPWNVDISGRWRHIGAVDPIDEGREHISAHDYLDLTVIWKITGFATLRAGMNNVFDKEPPVALGDPPVSNGNTLPGVYDALGRYWFAGLTVEF